MIISYKGDELEVNYIDQGEGDTIVLLHGWGAKAETYRSIINMLTPHFRVIAPDMPGFGASSEPSFAYTSEDYAGFVKEFLNKLSVKKAIFIGHSHGGRTIIKLASGTDNGIEIPKIVLFDSAGLIRKKSFSQKCKIAKFKIAKKLFSVSFISKLFPEYIENLRKKNGSADYAAASPIMRKSMVSVINEDHSECLKKIKAPTLLIWGENDNDTPMYQAKQMERDIPDSGLVVIKNAGHFSFVSDLVLTQRVLYSFLGI